MKQENGKETDSIEQIEATLQDEYGDRVFSVEDGVVWVSGMNSSCKSVARRMARTLAHGHDIPTSLVYDDDADRFGGVQFNWGKNA